MTFANEIDIRRIIQVVTVLRNVAVYGRINVDVVPLGLNNEVKAEVSPIRVYVTIDAKGTLKTTTLERILKRTFRRRLVGAWVQNLEDLLGRQEIQGMAVRMVTAFVPVPEKTLITRLLSADIRHSDNSSTSVEGKKI